MSTSLVPYVFLFLVAALPSIVRQCRRSRGLWVVAWIAFVGFVGLRHRIGGDWGNYVRKAEYLSQLSLFDAIRFGDPLFSALTWLSTQIGFGVYGANLVGAIIFCSGLFAFCARMPNRWLALTAATPFLVVASAMSASRQGIALGVFLFVASRWHIYSVKAKSAGIVISGLFHSSAFVMLVLPILDLKESAAKKAIMLLMVFPLSLWLMSISDTGLDQYARIYFLEQRTEAPGALMHLSLNLLPAIAMLITQRWWSDAVAEWPMLRVLCFMAMGMLLLVPFFTQAVSRMSLYLFPVSITFFAYLPAMVNSAGSRSFVRFASVSLWMAVLIVWVEYSNQSYAYVPYQNVLTVTTDQLDLR